MSKKGENIYKRKDGRWEARYIKKHRPNGKAVYGYCYGKTYREVKNKRAEIILNYKLGYEESNLQKEKLTCFFDEWLKLKRSQIKESTYVKYESIIETHLKIYFANYSINMLTESAIEDFSYMLFSEKKLSPKTVKDILVVLNSVMKYISKQVRTFRQPDVIYPREGKKLMRILTLEEQKKFIKYLERDMNNLKFGTLLALCTGLRIGEVCALKWSDISMDSRCIHVSSSIQRIKSSDIEKESKTKIIISNPKSNSSIRIIPMSEYVFDLCSQMRTEDADYVLSGRSDIFIEPRVLQYHIKKYTEDCNLEDIHFHTLRHTFATRCVEVGFEIKSLSEILGHCSPKITLERYVHSSLGLKRDNIRKLEAIGI